MLLCDPTWANEETHAKWQGWITESLKKSNSWISLDLGPTTRDRAKSLNSCIPWAIMFATETYLKPKNNCYFFSSDHSFGGLQHQAWVYFGGN